MSKRYVHYQTLTKASGIIKPDRDCMQFVINNPTANPIKLALTLVNTDGYEFIVKAQSLFVSPVVHFPHLNFVIDGFAENVRIFPTVYCYNLYIGTPSITPLT